MESTNHSVREKKFSSSIKKENRVPEKVLHSLKRQFLKKKHLETPGKVSPSLKKRHLGTPRRFHIIKKQTVEIPEKVSTS